jgi:hypothetical protein
MRAIGSTLAGVGRAARDLMTPTTWLPEDQKPQAPFVLPMGDGEIRPRTATEVAAADPLQVGKPLYEPEPGSPTSEHNELARLLSRWSTPESLAVLPASKNPIAGALLLTSMIPGFVQQVKDAVSGGGTDEEKRDRVNDLVSLAALTISHRAAPAIREGVTPPPDIMPGSGELQGPLATGEVLQTPEGSAVPPKVPFNLPDAAAPAAEPTARPQVEPTAPVSSELPGEIVPDELVSPITSAKERMQTLKAQGLSVEEAAKKLSDEGVARQQAKRKHLKEGDIIERRQEVYDLDRDGNIVRDENGKPKKKTVISQGYVDIENGRMVVNGKLTGGLEDNSGAPFRFESGDRIIRKKTKAPVVPTAPTARAPMTQEEHASVYPVIKSDALVDGREQLNPDRVPNMSSIESSIDNPQILPGIREVPMSDFTLTGKHYSVEGQKKIDALAESIKDSGKISPLIVVRDSEGAYILEGATRADALFKLGAKSFPAKVVLDIGDIEKTKAPKPAAPPAPPAEPTLAEDAVGKATRTVLEPPNSVPAKLMFGEETKVSEIPNFTFRTTARGKKYTFALSEWNLSDGRKRFVLSAGDPLELVDAAALVKLTPNGPEIQMLHKGQTGFEGLAGAIAKEIAKRYGRPVIPENAPLSAATKKQAASARAPEPPVVPAKVEAPVVAPTRPTRLITEADLEKLSPAEQGTLGHANGIEYGVTLDESSVPDLETKYKQAAADQKAAFRSYMAMQKPEFKAGKTPEELAKLTEENNAEQLAAGGRMNYFGGALMGATRGQHPVSGSNYASWLKRRVAEGKPVPETPKSTPPPAAAPEKSVVGPEQRALLEVPTTPKARSQQIDILRRYDAALERQEQNAPTDTTIDKYNAWRDKRTEIQSKLKELESAAMKEAKAQTPEPKPAAPEKGLASDWTSATDETTTAKSGEDEVLNPDSSVSGNPRVLTPEQTAKQQRFREIFQNAKTAFEALRTIVDEQMFAGARMEVARELVKHGDLGVKLGLGGRFHSREWGTEAAGRYFDKTDTAHVYDAAFEHNKAGGTFLHEYIHALTKKAIESGKFRPELESLFKAAYIKAAREGLKFHGVSDIALSHSQGRGGWRAFGGYETEAINFKYVPHLQEFVAEALSNKKFQDFLNRTRSPLEKGAFRTLFDDFVGWLSKSFGIKQSSALRDSIRIGLDLAAERTKESKPATAELVNPPKTGLEALAGISIPKFANRKMSPLDRVTASHSGKLQKSFDEARRAQREIKAEVPSERRQNAISIWREAKGDAGTLQGWAAAAKGKLFKQAAIDAQTLTPKEIAIATKAGAAFDALHARGTKFDVLRSHRDAYVPHVWDVGKPGTGFGTGMLKQRFRFSKARTFDTFFDGDQAGFKPKTLAIGKLLPAYIHEMNTVIADRQAVRDIVAGTNKDGSPMAVPRGNSKVVEGDEGRAVLVQPRAMKGELDTSDYKMMSDQPALANWTWASKDTAGRPVFIKSDLALHPDAYRRINAMIGQSALRQWYHDPVTGTAQIPRAIVRGLDTAQSMMKREMFGLLAPFHQVQEGTHGIGHMVNPFSHIPKVDLRDPAQLDAANHGLMLLPDRASARVYLEGVGAKSSLLSQGIRKLGRLGEAISDVIDGYQDYLFHQYIPGLKFKTYQAILGRNMKRYAGELKSGEMTTADVKITSAEQSNAAYGHLNYALLDRNPTMQHLIQMSTLAPDFLEARSRFAGQAVKGLSSPVGAEQLKAIAILAAVQAGSAYIISNVTGGQYDPRHPFEVVHNGRRYAMRSVPEDIFSLLKDTRQFAYSRVNPLLVKGGIQLATGLNYRGEKTGPLDTFTELLAGYIPITARQLPGLRSLTATSRQNPVSPLQQLAGSLGLRISRYSPVSETYKLAGKWMDSQKMDRSKGSYPISKYQQLRYALEDGDLDRAKTEYDALIKTAPPGKIATGFKESINHPFTGKKSTDEAFAATLTGYDKALYLQALRTRTNMLNAFARLPGMRSSAPVAPAAAPPPPWEQFH